MTAMRAIELAISCGARALGIGSFVGFRGSVDALRKPNAPALLMRSGRIIVGETKQAIVT